MRIIPLIALAVTSVVLTGCAGFELAKYEPNQKLRAELFQSCLTALPPGPSSEKYNDWEIAVAACSKAAYDLSLYCYENCPPPPAIKKEDAA